MRYTLAILALGLGLSVVMPAAFASERDGRDLSAAGVTAQAGTSDAGTIAGPAMNHNQLGDQSHDRN